MKFCLLFNLEPVRRVLPLIGSQLTTWSQGNLHYIRLHFFQLDREFFCLLPSLTRLYSNAASPSERLRSDGSLAKSSQIQCGGFTNLLCKSVKCLQRMKSAFQRKRSAILLSPSTNLLSVRFHIADKYLHSLII